VSDELLGRPRACAAVGACVRVRMRVHKDSAAMVALVPSAASHRWHTRARMVTTSTVDKVVVRRTGPVTTQRLQQVCAAIPGRAPVRKRRVQTKIASKPSPAQQVCVAVVNAEERVSAMGDTFIHSAY